MSSPALTTSPGSGATPATDELVISMYPVPGCATVDVFAFGSEVLAGVTPLRHPFSGCTTNTSTIAFWRRAKDSIHRCRRGRPLWCTNFGRCPRSGAFLFRVLDLIARCDRACPSPSSSCRWWCSGGVPRPCSPVRHGTQLCEARGGTRSLSSIQKPEMVSRLSVTQAEKIAECPCTPSEGPAAKSHQPE